MPSPFETEIHALLRDFQNPTRVAEELLRRWSGLLLSEEQQVDTAQFLVASGQLPLFFKHLRTLIEARAPLPWTQVAEAIGRAKIKPDAFEIESLFEGAKVQNALGALLRSYQLDVWSRTFATQRAQYIAANKSSRDLQKQELRERIDFVRAQQIPQQEIRLLEEARAHFPNEPEFQGAREAFELRQAREVISRSLENSQVGKRGHFEKQTPELKVVKDLIVSRARELVLKTPELAHDLAMNLHFMDFNQEAIQILELAPSSAPIDWLKLELMIQARSFVTALDEATLLEQKYANDPEAAFAAAYSRARAFAGLGEIEMAANVLRGIIKVRPTYKSAQSLLLEWTEGEE